MTLGIPPCGKNAAGLDVIRNVGVTYRNSIQLATVGKSFVDSPLNLIEQRSLRSQRAIR